MIKENQKAPAFSLNNQEGKSIKLSDLIGKSVVLYFYPKDLTPGCTLEARDFSKNLDKFREKNAVVLGVSFDDEKRHQKFISVCGLDIDLLADGDKEVAKKYGVYEKKKFMGREFMGIVRSTFIIDPKGKIKKIFKPVKVLGHAKEVLENL